ncbi:dihydroorotase/N-acyl-D-amino-acid deacylase [Haloactinopolyspora alba]|uniref:Dihydroorotase/N-acyl-D-amino-acid deacylase n=1 Tax=Haloactinopolyspora alba TaxID=648780 RepID=A0A2P8EG36_9ACTN|nr:amidohydrolase family protein [Haloactinopolyspora alba]PSL08433.1 dihydroorotase/N-acyl-D-amino-acid deacylase [Haloactinopolyspora alba]
MSPELDLLITGADVVDGSGAPSARADVGVRAGRIVVLPPDSGAVATEVLTAHGRIVMPGIIDVHTHSDLLGGADPEREELRRAALLQGVTTEICGNCGTSAFPALPERAGDVAELVSATFGSPAAAYPDLPGYLAAQEGHARANHLVTLVGHGTLRAGVLGFADRPASRAEVATMSSLLDQALRDGAAGLSSGLIYPPGIHADTSEIVALARVVAAHGKPYVTHLRDEMSRVEDALEEALSIAHASGASLQVSHHKTAGRAAWGTTTRTLKRLTAERARGLDVLCDVYPYTAGSTVLHAMLPPWITSGGVGAMLATLGEDGVRGRIRADIASGLPGWENTVGNGGWDLIVVASAARTPQLEGVSVAEAAASAGTDPVDLACDLLLANDGEVTIISRSMHEDDVRRVVASPLSMIASDGVPKLGRPHPRWAGTFARTLGRYVRHEEVLTLEDAVHKMTGMPAGRFGLRGRGVIRDGATADLVVLDPGRVRDTATYDDPLARPKGIRAVVVDGQVVVDDGDVRDERPGRALRIR